MLLKFEKYSEDKKQIWEKINLEAENSSFLSSINWIDFQKSLGKEIDQYFIILEVGDREYEIGILYIEIYRRKFIKYAYVPYGPVIVGDPMNEQEFADFFTQLKNFMQDYIFQNFLTLFRFDPLLPKKYSENLKNLGFKTSLAPAQAKDVWELDLDQNEDELRSKMSDSTRYNINRSSRSELELVKATTIEEVKAFSDLMNETTQRKGFGNYDFEYFKKQFDALNPKGMTDIFLARYRAKYISGALINYYNETAYYTHGASTSDRTMSKLRSPYFLQWEIMKYAKEKGFRKYNMWGILPKSLPENKKAKNPMNGVSEFKRSFGGKEINYVGPMEIYNDNLRYLLHRAIDFWSYRKDRY